MTDSPDRDERHLARMLRKKAVIDERIANSPNECGLLLVLTGNGKGKSSSAFDHRLPIERLRLPRHTRG